MTIREKILTNAFHAVTVDRNAAHGKPEDTFRHIAAQWSAYLGHPLAPHDVACMMALMKIARIKGNPTHEDSWTDLAGYAACGAEAALGRGDPEPAG